MQYIHEDLPYYSQWISRDMVHQIVNGHIEAKEDPLWEQSGAQDPDEYEFWSRNICGIACLKMILESLNISSEKLITMAKECERYGGFVINEETIDGLYYKPFLEYINQKYKLQGIIYAPLSIEDIICETGKGNYIIASVQYSIRFPDDAYSGNKGGHLVLISGFDLGNDKLYIHNPSGVCKKTQEYAPINIQAFTKYFANRGMVIYRL